MVLGILVCMSLPNSVRMLIVSNALLISDATVTVRSGDSFWLKPVVTVLSMQCSAVSVECLLLYPCCVVLFPSPCIVLHSVCVFCL